MFQWVCNHINQLYLMTCRGKVCIHTTFENVGAIKNCSSGQGKVQLAQYTLYRGIKEKLFKKRGVTDCFLVN